MRQGLTRIKDVDLIVLEKLGDEDLFQICGKTDSLEIKNRYIHHICSNQDFWRNRLAKKFPNVDLDYWKDLSFKDKYLRTVYYVDKMKREYDFEFKNGDPRMHYIGLYLIYALKYKGTVEELLNTKTLYLSGNQLKEIPKEIGNLRHLQEIDLSENELTEIPKEIGNLQELLSLNLSENELTEIPKEIGNLQELQEIDLSFNKLTEIPKEIYNLQELLTLNLSDNKFKEIPKEIGNLKKLQELYLSDNKFKEIPKEIGNLKKLRILFFNYTKLTEIPKEIRKIPGLKIYNNY